MANHASAIKRHRQSIKRRDSNRVAKGDLRTEAKKVRTLIAAGKVEEARQQLKQTESRWAKAAVKGLVHKKNAARKISRLAKAAKAAAK